MIATNYMDFSFSLFSFCRRCVTSLILAQTPRLLRWMEHSKKLIPVLSCPIPVLEMKFKKADSVILVIFKDMNNHINGELSTRALN